jgi:hypothetical protein
LTVGLREREGEGGGRLGVDRYGERYVWRRYTKLRIGNEGVDGWRCRWYRSSYDGGRPCSGDAVG